MTLRRFLLLVLVFVPACKRTEVATPVRPSILLVTLDTTRADAVGPDAKNVRTPSFNALVARGTRYLWAYTPVPQTLPAHTSMLTGLYPAGHGVHENARHLQDDRPLISERLHGAGYRTAAFVSAFALARQFGLARGFDVYEDDFGKERAERPAGDTTERAIAFLQQQKSSAPLFLWVHYYDPHFPYTPPEPFLTQYAKAPYYGEIAYMDQQLGRLTDAWNKTMGAHSAIIVLGDHGEGLGEHGEQQHGDLLYQATVHVPLLIIGPNGQRGVDQTPFSTRHVFDVILEFAGLAPHPPSREIVLGEAMKPFLDYGWQPQVMAVESHQKTILAGKTEVYDVIADPGETHNLAAAATLSRDVRVALQQYPIPTPASAATASAPSNMSEEDRKKLASLGYVASDVRPVLRKDAPRPADMASLFPILDEAASLFVRREYTRSIVLLEEIERKDPYNLDAVLRLATAQSALGHDAEALAAFQHAQSIAPDSPDVRTYLALHYARGKDWKKAEPMLEQIVAQSPDRVPALEALAMIREREGRIDETLALRQKVYALRTPNPGELVHMGVLAMQTGRTDVAIDAFEKSRAADSAAFANDLELGVLYLADGTFTAARDALDRVPASSAAWPMALFKRAQVSVLLHEPDAPARVEAARTHANAMTRELIARERLFH
jgi:arylsulfatase A-like enzyme/tetratricopeptide (TPR) repeat protein